MAAACRSVPDYVHVRFRNHHDDNHGKKNYAWLQLADLFQTMSMFALRIIMMNFVRLMRTEELTLATHGM
jgi:hypothetical protein